METTPPHARPGQAPSFWRSPSGLALLVVIAVTGFYLYTEHRAHLYGALPFILLLACPLMHVFMHHGRRGHGGHSHHGRRADDHE
ncbi:MAG TPA: DUF2933 domain-containing protein [Albitalea sp.]|nr:DUF2933 domain-containing protein [Albitalea sp.]